MLGYRDEGSSRRGVEVGLVTCREVTWLVEITRLVEVMWLAEVMRLPEVTWLTELL